MPNRGADCSGTDIDINDIKFILYLINQPQFWISQAIQHRDFCVKLSINNPLLIQSFTLTYAKLTASHKKHNALILNEIILTLTRIEVNYKYLF
jgi:hypothetical protein